MRAVIREATLTRGQTTTKPGRSAYQLVDFTIHLLTGCLEVGSLVRLTGGGGPGGKDRGQCIAVVGCEGRTREKVEQATEPVDKIDRQGACAHLRRVRVHD